LTKGRVEDISAKMLVIAYRKSITRFPTRYSLMKCIVRAYVTTKLPEGGSKTPLSMFCTRN